MSTTLSPEILEDLSKVSPPEKYETLKEILDNRFDSFIKRPTHLNWLEKVAKDIPNETLVSYANKSYPLLHESVLPLIQDFLAFKKIHGSSVEKSIYAQMDIIGFVNRLISKRPLSFVGGVDGYTLRNGQHGANDWELVGTEKERKDHTMEDYMTYDEIKISAFLQISSPVAPINGGSRDNIGRRDSNHVTEAVYVGAVGARFERQGQMEYQEMVITKSQNIKENGYGADGKLDHPKVLDVFAKFYGLDYFPLHSESADSFNGEIYLKRIETSVQTFFLEANARGKQWNQKVYAHVVGLGLGVWMYRSQIQNSMYLKAFQNVLENVELPFISDIDFSWISSQRAEDKFVNENHFPGTQVTIRFTRRDPFAKFPEKNGKLVVALYAWDGNSFPGNEYWLGHLSASGDPAAACCTQIPELQNAYINKANICAENLHVASSKHGLLHIAKYAEEEFKAH